MREVQSKNLYMVPKGLENPAAYKIDMVSEYKQRGFAIFGVTRSLEFFET